MKNNRLILILSLLFYTPWQLYADNYHTARQYQQNGEFDKAIESYTDILLNPAGDKELDADQVKEYTDALVQFMNSFQSKGDPEACISALRDLYEKSPILQSQCLRDYYSVLGYALSRTEYMNDAESAMQKALSLPLQSATPERYFRDYAYAAAVFYSNPQYAKEVLDWCHEALKYAKLSNNTSGSQWVTAMMGSLYKRDGDLHKALELYKESMENSHSQGDDLGVLNSLHSIIDLFLYWDIPEYADRYANEAVRMQENMESVNPMISAQTYINKGRTLHMLGKSDSISFYSDKAAELCKSLPYNSGMVDVDLLNGIFLTEQGAEYLEPGINRLQNVAQKGTSANRAKAYHQLSQVYLELNENSKAEAMLDSLYSLLSQNDSHILHLDYAPILEYYHRTGNQDKAELYIDLLLKEHNEFKNNRVDASLIDVIVGFQTEKKIHEMEISQLKDANQRLWMMILLAISFAVIFIIVVLMLSQKNRYRKQMKQVDIKLETLVQKLNESNLENEIRAHEIEEFLSDKEKRRKLETLAPHILKESGDVKFRQCFELLFPLFLHRLREKVPTVSRREELLSMLIVLKQDNKEIAELLAVAPRSVLMLRHRFRQKIGMTTEHSLDNFIESLLKDN